MVNTISFDLEFPMNLEQSIKLRAVLKMLLTTEFPTVQMDLYDCNPVRLSCNTEDEMNRFKTRLTYLMNTN